MLIKQLLLNNIFVYRIMHFNIFFVKKMPIYSLNSRINFVNWSVYMQHNQQALDFLQLVTYKAQRCLCSRFITSDIYYTQYECAW